MYYLKPLLVTLVSMVVIFFVLFFFFPETSLRFFGVGFGMDGVQEIVDSMASELSSQGLSEDAVKSVLDSVDIEAVKEAARGIAEDIDIDIGAVADSLLEGVM